MEETPRYVTQIKGVLGLLAITAFVLVLLGMYQKVFTSTTNVTVTSDRSGLQLDKGASVRAFGVPVGEVRGVKLAKDGKGVDIEVALDNGEVEKIPQGVAASIRSTTVFGAKFVQLDVPKGPVVSAIKNGAVVKASSVPIEANDVFAHAMDLLDTVDPDKLNTTLTSISKAFDGNGENIGSLIDDTDSFLSTLNPSLDQLETDLDLTADVAGNLDDVAPDVLETVEQLTTTTDLLKNQEKEFGQVLRQVVPAADSVGALIASFDKPLTLTVDNLLTPSRTLFEYSPALPCTLDGLVGHVDILGKALGRARPVADANASFLPGVEPYNQSNLPKLVTGVGPTCYAEGGTAELLNPPHVQLDDGTKDVYTDDSGVVDVDTSPITIYEDTLKSFFGNSGAKQFLDSLGLLGPQAPQSTPTAPAASTTGEDD